MSRGNLIGLSGSAAVLAGSLRAGTSFLSSVQPSHLVELLYRVIDVSILLGLLGIYAYQNEEVGVLGLVGFLMALVGTAILVGPDGMIGGVDMYAVGAFLLSIGLAVFSISLWRADGLSRWVPTSWRLSTAFGLGGPIVGAPVLLLIAGLSFGLGFVIAGFGLWMDPSLRRS